MDIRFNYKIAVNPDDEKRFSTEKVSSENLNTNFVNSVSEVPIFPDMFNGGNEIGSYRRELISFIENIRKGVKPSPGFKEAEKATKVTHAVLKSVKLDKKVKVIL